jgi:hypothetical protein
MLNILNGVIIFLVIALIGVGIVALELTKVYEQLVNGNHKDTTQPDNQLTFEDALVEVDAMYVHAYLNNDNERMKVLYEVLQRLSKLYESHSNNKTLEDEL